MKLLIRGGHILRMDAARTVLENGYVLIEDQRITGVGPMEDAPSASEVNHVEDASGCLVVPGLINSHQHHWYHLLKGMSVGLYLEDWVQQVLTPATQALEKEEFVLSVNLAAADMSAADFSNASFYSSAPGKCTFSNGNCAFPLFVDR